jgi:hypothetical protein
MKILFNRYSYAILVVLAVAFLAIIIGGFTWGIGDIVTESNEAVNARLSTGQAPSFDLTGASALDYRGAPPANISTSTAQ